MYNYEENKAEWTDQDKTGLGLDFANLPYFIDGDFKLTESGAILNYVCEKWAPELLGATPQARGENSRMLFLLKDYFVGWIMMAFQGKTQAECSAKAKSSIVPFVDFLASKNFLVGDSVQMVDFVFFELIDTVNALNHDKSLFVDHPTLEAYFARMEALPGLNRAENMASGKFVKLPFFISKVPLDMQIQE